jgi:hypothetical protein
MTPHPFLAPASPAGPQARSTVLPAAVAALFAALVCLQCQSPVEHPGMQRRTVTVHVVDTTLRPIATLPVALHRGTVAAMDEPPLATRVTDGAGNASFEVDIPATGGRFVLVAGDDAFGRIPVEANLLCRDTAVTIVFALRNLPCNDSRADLIRLADLCVYAGGRGVADSAQQYYRSGCSVPLAMTCTPIDDPFRLRAFVVGADGNPVRGSTFTLPPAGFFTVRAVATPADTGRILRTMTIAGTGSGGASLAVTVTIDVSAVACEGCPCEGDTVEISLPMTQAQPAPQSVVQAFSILRNRGNCDRVDRLVSGPSRTDIFALAQPIRQTVRPGEYQTLQIRFTPKEIRAYADTIVIDHLIPDNNRSCRSMVILRAAGCGPLCAIDSATVEPSAPAGHFDVHLRARVYQSDATLICFRNAGACGTLALTQGLETPLRGFSTTPTRLELDPGERGCFTASFNAADSIVWPNGHGRPAVVHFERVMTVAGCGAGQSIRLIADVDTIPILFSRCIYQWNENQNLGYNFTPPELKGSEIFDADPIVAQITDLVVGSVAVGSSADVYIRSRWKLIRCGVSEAAFTFAQVSAWPEYPGITSGAFSMARPAAFQLGCVYTVRVERSGDLSYALVRVRECSSDADGKHKMCIDVLYPMIEE